MIKNILLSPEKNTTFCQSMRGILSIEEYYQTLKIKIRVYNSSENITKAVLAMFNSGEVYMSSINKGGLDFYTAEFNEQSISNDILFAIILNEDVYLMGGLSGDGIVDIKKELSKQASSLSDNIDYQNNNRIDKKDYEMDYEKKYLNSIDSGSEQKILKTDVIKKENEQNIEKEYYDNNIKSRYDEKKDLPDLKESQNNDAFQNNYENYKEDSVINEEVEKLIESQISGIDFDMDIFGNIQKNMNNTIDKIVNDSIELIDRPVEKLDTNIIENFFSSDELLQKMKREKSERLQNNEYIEKSKSFENSEYNTHSIRDVKIEKINQKNNSIDQNKNEINVFEYNKNNNQNKENVASKIKSENKFTEKKEFKKATESINFFDGMLEQFDNIFKQYPIEEKLQYILPDSKFVIIEDKYLFDSYILGAIYEDEKIKYLAYGVPATYNSEPPIEMKDNCQWLPLDLEDPLSDGYYIMYQDASSGELLQIDVV